MNAYTPGGLSLASTKVKLGGVLTALAVATAVLGALPRAAAADGELAAAVAAAQAAATDVALLAVDATTGEVLLAHHPEQVQNLASNAKLFTTAAALDALGPDHRFETVLAANLGPLGLAMGPLWVIGGGDPGLRKKDLRAMARAARKTGLVAIERGIAVDDSLYGGVSVPPAFDQKDDPAAFRTTVSALGVDSNAAWVSFRPGPAVDQPPRITLKPSGPWALVDNQATTVQGDAERLTIFVDAAHGRTRFVATGTIGIDHKGGVVSRRVEDPALLFASILRDQLLSSRIAVQGGEPFRAPRGESTQELVRYAGRPLSELVAQINETSDNAMAETLFLALGAKGKSDAAGAAQSVLDLLARAGAPPGARILNGSGLYEADFASPEQVVAVLRWAMAQPWGEVFRKSLAVAGKTGTMKKRMLGTPLEGVLRAKTGTLEQVSTLSGYLPIRGGKTIAFAFLFSGIAEDHGAVRAAQDALCLALVRL